MHVGVNALGLDLARPNLNSQFLQRVLPLVEELQPGVSYTVFTSPGGRRLSGRYPVREILGCSTPGDGGYLVPPRGLEIALREAGVDLLFGPAAWAPGRSSVPQVLLAAALDGWHESVSAFRVRDASRRKALTRRLRNAAAIVAPSEHLRRRLIEGLSIGMDRVTVAPPGLEGAASANPLVDPPYIVAAAGRGGAQIWDVILEASRKIQGAFPHGLVALGAPEDPTPESVEPGVLWIEALPAAHRIALYQHCAACVCAAPDDGAGLDVAEALRAGAPVAAAQGGANSEAGGDAPVYFEPGSPQGLAAALRRLLGEDAAARSRRVQLGQQAVARFDWRECASRTLSAFQRVFR